MNTIHGAAHRAWVKAKVIAFSVSPTIFDITSVAYAKVRDSDMCVPHCRTDKEMKLSPHAWASTAAIADFPQPLGP
jgi:hypothetical protein